MKKRKQHAEQRWVAIITTDGAVDVVKSAYPKKGMFLFVDYKTHKKWKIESA